MEKKRSIIDYSKLTPEVLEAVNKKYPYGWDDGDIVKFKTAKGDIIKAIPIELEDASYLVKAGQLLEDKLEAYLEDEEDDVEDEDDLDDVDDSFTGDDDIKNEE